MRIIESLADFPTSLPCPVMTIGVFDGVHKGHQSILKQVVAQAEAAGGTSILLTFTPHPQKVIAPDSAPRLLQTPRQKEEILERSGIDILLRLPFTRSLSLCSPEEFAETILRNHGIREIHVGGNFRFGHRRSGDVGTLGELGRKLGFVVHEVPPVSFRGRRISSSRIRAVLAEGGVALARRFLGRPYQIRGTIVRAGGRGRELGFPTANLEPESELMPAVGVYITRSLVGGREFLSVTNVGFRPTVPGQRSPVPVVESHLLDFEGSLYGESVALDFRLRLRPERKFEDVTALRKQIARDVQAARRYHERLSECRASGL